MPLRPTCHTFRRSRRRSGKSHRDGPYIMRVGLPGQRPIEKSTGLRDKRAADKHAREYLQRLELEQAGLVQPRTLTDAVDRPLSEHLTDRIADLKARGRAKVYIANTRDRLTRLFNDCSWRLLRDVKADDFTRWRSARADDLSPSTLNQYLDHARGFFAWLVSQGRAAGNPLQNLAKASTARRDACRRALSIQEQTRLLQVSGPRAAAYLLALHTGLRRGEIDDLHWSDVHLDADTPFILARASTTKNAKPAAQPITPDLANLLRDLHNATGGKGRVLPKGCPPCSDLRADLEAADITEVDDLGRRVDFHALRHTFITTAAATGAPQAVVQRLARHSDAQLTQRVYTDAARLPTRAAIDSMPSLDLPRGLGRLAADHHRPRGPRDGTLERDVAGRFVSDRVAATDSGERSQPIVRQRISRDLTRAVASGRGCLQNRGTRIRT